MACAHERLAIFVPVINGRVVGPRCAVCLDCRAQAVVDDGGWSWVGPHDAIPYVDGAAWLALSV